jgi:hypothetical protein
LVAIFSGRMVRFLLLGLLTVKFGPNVVRIVGGLFRQHLYVVMLVAAAGVVAWLMHRKSEGRTRKSKLTDAKKTQPGDA